MSVADVFSGSFSSMPEGERRDAFRKIFDICNEAQKNGDIWIERDMHLIDVMDIAKEGLETGGKVEQVSSTLGERPDWVPQCAYRWGIVDGLSNGSRWISINVGSWEYVLRYVEAGTFESNGQSIEISKPFFIGATVVCRELWDEWPRFYSELHVSGDPYYHQHPAAIQFTDLYGCHPLEKDSNTGLHKATTEYAPIVQLSQKLGITCRLPTEAEWEYACRAGTNRDLNIGLDLPENKMMQEAGAALSLIGYNDYYHNLGNRDRPVGRGVPNAWGLYDMHGNSWEMCLDTYSAEWPNTYHYNPDDPHVCRGGNWDSLPMACTSSSRSSTGNIDSETSIGFRLVIEVG